MSERYILSYFKSPEQAEGVARKLKALRVTELSIDRFSRYGGSGDLNSGSTTSGILEAADASASGMSHGGNGGPTGRDILLTVVLDSQIYDQALDLIEEAGGTI